MQTPLKITLAALVALLLLVYGCRYWPQSKDTASAEELTEVILTSSDPNAKEKAAFKLIKVSDPTVLVSIRRVLDETDSASVKIAMLRGLGAKQDYESMPAILDALEDPSPSVRRVAAVITGKMIFKRLKFRAGDTPENRAKAVKQIRAQWEHFRNLPIFKDWQESKNGEEQ